MNAVTDMPQRERPLSEQYRIVAKQYVDADAAATLREELKTATMEQLKTALLGRLTDAGETKVPESRLEREVKASPEWESYIRDMIEDRTKANRLKAQLEYIRMKHGEWMSANANLRHEARLGR